jgi:hypothetical protein
MTRNVMTTDEIQNMVDSVNMIVAMAKSSLRDRDRTPFFLRFPVSGVLEKIKEKRHGVSCAGGELRDPYIITYTHIGTRHR